MFIISMIKAFMLSLRQYVKRTNGVPMGATHSLRNMLYRAFGAGSFATFWHYWNPIWGYYLSRYIMRPLNIYLPKALAVWITFLFSGALHDLAVSLIKWQLIVFFTPWFGLMGALALVSTPKRLSYRDTPWLVRATTNALLLGVSLMVTFALENLLAQHWAV
ncbi:acyltransferase [Pseudoalteromonas ruthenica]|uniref:acyltransferase n=1 Tax=Pseudoalteromonas ruthenica TaxID=151081 RepID=UPI00320A541A